ncbi:MAG: NUDIX domain-containing protein [Cellvibrionaceae bacterium]
MINKLPPATFQLHEAVEVSQRKAVYQGFFKMEQVQLRHRLFEGGWSKTITREVFVRGEAVAAVMFDPEHNLIGLVEQFRVGALDDDHSPWLYEVVAGMTEPNEQPVDVIRRELLEEADMTPEKLIPICDYYSSPGGTDESLTLYCALGDLRSVGGIHGLPEEGENIQVVVLSTDSVFEHLYDGRFNNAATLICLQWLQLNHAKLKASYRENSYGPS